VSAKAPGASASRILHVDRVIADRFRLPTVACDVGQEIGAWHMERHLQTASQTFETEHRKARARRRASVRETPRAECFARIEVKCGFDADHRIEVMVGKFEMRRVHLHKRAFGNVFPRLGELYLGKLIAKIMSGA
jgi:hypothetical protein